MRGGAAPRVVQQLNGWHRRDLVRLSAPLGRPETLTSRRVAHLPANLPQGRLRGRLRALRRMFALARSRIRRAIGSRQLRRLARRCEERRRLLVRIVLRQPPARSRVEARLRAPSPGQGIPRQLTWMKDSGSRDFSWGTCGLSLPYLSALSVLRCRVRVCVCVRISACSGALPAHEWARWSATALDHPRRRRLEDMDDLKRLPLAKGSLCSVCGSRRPPLHSPRCGGAYALGVPRQGVP